MSANLLRSAATYSEILWIVVQYCTMILTKRCQLIMPRTQKMLCEISYRRCVKTFVNLSRSLTLRLPTQDGHVVPRGRVRSSASRENAVANRALDLQRWKCSTSNTNTRTIIAFIFLWLLNSIRYAPDGNIAARNTFPISLYFHFF